jgi:hypothetical protein
VSVGAGRIQKVHDGEFLRLYRERGLRERLLQSRDWAMRLRRRGGLHGTDRQGTSMHRRSLRLREHRGLHTGVSEHATRL